MIYSLELTYSTRCFDQAGVHDLATTQFYKRQFLAGHSLFEFQVLRHNDPQHTFLLRQDNSLQHKLNRIWEVEPLEQSTITEQQSCEQHFSTHTTQQDGKLWSNFQHKWILSSLDLLTFLRNKDFMQLNAGWNEIQTSMFSTTTS